MNVPVLPPSAAIDFRQPSQPFEDAVLVQREAAAFSDALGAAMDRVSSAVEHADALAAAIPERKASIADAAIARAKADVALEVAAVAASRVTGAISVLMQTQL